MSWHYLREQEEEPRRPFVGMANGLCRRMGRLPRMVLLARQRDGILPRFPIWDDVQTFDGKPWRGRVDVVSGGFPCRDISAAAREPESTVQDQECGTTWHGSFARWGPRFVFVENSPMLTSRGLGRVLGDLARWGMMRNGACWDATTLVDLTSAKGSGSGLLQQNRMQNDATI